MQFHLRDAILANPLRPRYERLLKSTLIHAILWMAVLWASWGTLEANAQFAVVRGHVADHGDDQPLPGAAVVLENEAEGARFGTAADGNGIFILSRIPPGDYVLRASFVGYIPYVDTLSLNFNEEHTLNIRLEPDEAAVGELVVESERQVEERGGAGFASVRPSDLARVPTPGVSPDLASYLQTMPGVVTTGDRGGHLFIRGGTPTQNLVMLDGMPVFQPFHIIGFYSAFPANIISYSDVYTGGFSARYGGRLSSVIDVSARNGNKQRVTGGVSLAPFLGSVHLEVPVVPERVSLIASVRESVIERIAPDLLGQELPYRFGDRFLKFHAFLNRTSSMALTALRTHDEGDIADTKGRPNKIEWTNEAYGGHYTYLPETFAAMTRLSFFTTRMNSSYEPYGASSRASQVISYGTDIQFTYYLGITTARIGLFGLSHRLFFELEEINLSRKEFLTEGGAYVDMSIEIGSKLKIDPSVRLHAFPSRHETKIEPRFRAEWRPGGQTSRHVINVAWGIYHQELVGLFNARDITDAFVAWAPSPEERDVPASRHLLAGWQGGLISGLTLGAEVYYKGFENMVFAEFGEEFKRGIRVADVAGEAYGFDLRLEVKQPWFYGALNYGYAKVIYELDQENLIVRFEDRPGPNGIQRVLTTRTESSIKRFAPPHDRRHQINALTHFSIGRFGLSMRWQFGSGLPFTPAQGFYNKIPFRNQGPDDDFRSEFGTPVLVQERETYQARLPAYHRFDISLDRRFEMNRFTATIEASVINVFDRANLFDYNVFTQQRVNQLPFLPSLGINVEFK